MPALVLHVKVDHRGGWLVAVRERGTSVRCGSLGEARELARRYAEQLQPCDIVVHDAYERVLAREHVGAAGER